MTKYVVPISFLVTILFFQNCSNQAETISVDTKPRVERLRSTSDLNKITHSRLLNAEPEIGLDNQILNIDLATGSMTLSENSIVKDCQLDSVRLEELDLLLRDGSICRISPAPNTVVCMALSFEDLKLENNSGFSIYLRSEICSSGVVLCDGRDIPFREILEDIKSNPPRECL